MPSMMISSWGRLTEYSLDLVVFQSEPASILAGSLIQFSLLNQMARCISDCPRYFFQSICNLDIGDIFSRLHDRKNAGAQFVQLTL